MLKLGTKFKKRWSHPVIIDIQGISARPVQFKKYTQNLYFCSPYGLDWTFRDSTKYCGWIGFGAGADGTEKAPEIFVHIRQCRTVRMKNLFILRTPSAMRVTRVQDEEFTSSSWHPYYTANIGMWLCDPCPQLRWQQWKSVVRAEKKPWGRTEMSENEKKKRVRPVMDEGGDR